MYVFNMWLLIEENKCFIIDQLTRKYFNLMCANNWCLNESLWKKNQTISVTKIGLKRLDSKGRILTWFLKISVSYSFLVLITHSGNILLIFSPASVFTLIESKISSKCNYVPNSWDPPKMWESHKQMLTESSGEVTLYSLSNFLWWLVFPSIIYSNSYSEGEFRLSNAIADKTEFAFVWLY